MDNELLLILILLTMHFFGDFVFQDDATATGKSSSNLILLKHVLIMSMPFLILLCFGLAGVYFVLTNAAIHFCIDYVTSRWTASEWKKGNRHNFFVIIGLDQLLHAFTLIGLAKWLLMT